jgi:hypothetical protein
LTGDGFACSPATAADLQVGWIMLRRINISLAVILLICFFLPWEQVSCGGASDTLSGFDLARHDHVSLWLIPLVMLSVLVFALVRRRQARLQSLAVISLVSAAVTAYLLNDERGRVRDASGIISAQLTGWFWLAFISSLAMIAGSVAMLLKRERAP